MAKKGNRITVIMRSSQSRYFYTARRRKAAEKMKQRSYDPSEGVRKHVLFEEEKVK